MVTKRDGIDNWRRHSPGCTRGRPRPSGRAPAPSSDEKRGPHAAKRPLLRSGRPAQRTPMGGPKAQAACCIPGLWPWSRYGAGR